MKLGLLLDFSLERLTEGGLIGPIGPEIQPKLPNFGTFSDSKIPQISGSLHLIQVKTCIICFSNPYPEYFNRQIRYIFPTKVHYPNKYAYSLQFIRIHTFLSTQVQWEIYGTLKVLYL